MTETIIRYFSRTCIRCGHVFQAEGKFRICDKCRMEILNKPKPKWICESCGQEFELRNKTSRKCKTCRAKEKELMQDRKPKLCLWCQAPFFARNYVNKFCSNECSKAFHTMLNQIWSNARESEVYFRERVKLEKEGKNYHLIERRLFEESEENEEL